MSNNLAGKQYLEPHIATFDVARSQSTNGRAEARKAMREDNPKAVEEIRDYVSNYLAERGFVCGEDFDFGPADARKSILPVLPLRCTREVAKVLSGADRINSIFPDDLPFLD